MLTTDFIKNELLKDENIEIEINHYGGLEVYHNDIYTEPILDEIIGNLYNRIDY